MFCLQQHKVRGENTRVWQQVAQHGCASFITAAAIAAGIHVKEHSSWFFSWDTAFSAKQRGEKRASDSVFIRGYHFLLIVLFKLYCF